VPDAARGTAALSADESHHLLHVLRLKAGDAVLAFDGQGNEWIAEIKSVDRSQVTLSILEPHEPLLEPPVAVTLAIGLLKGDDMRSVVRDATMLGVATIAPFVSDHTAVPGEARYGRSIDGWRRVAVASAKQCRRAVVPVIHPVSSLDAVLAAEAGVRICCVEPHAAADWSAPEARGDRPRSATVCIGPEGGWSASDLDCLRRRGARSLDLGPRTLRAETAPTVALSVLWAEWGWQ